MLLRLIFVLCGLSIAVVSAAEPAQERPAQQPAAPTPALMLSIGDAVARAVDGSEEVQLAEAQVDAAATRIDAARSAALPQLGATTAYARTFQSAFQRGLQFQLSDADRFTPDPTAPLEQRVQYLEQNSDKAVLTTLSDLISTSLQNVGLGSPHAYSLNVNASQLLYSGGRVSAGIGAARSVRDAAQFNAQESKAAIELQVRTAYYRALLARELESIAQAALAQAEQFLGQEQTRLQAGFASDLDVLRAEVSLENLRPQLVEARNAQELSMLDLKRLVNVPLDQPIELTTPLEAPASLAEEPRVAATTLVANRAAVRAAESQVAAAAQGVRAAQAAYKPSVSLQVAYGGQVFPRGLFNFDNAPWQPNGTATVGVQIPIFNGFQRAADVAHARVQQRQAELQAAQLRESVQLQYEQAIGERERARATIAARQRTVEQAQRVYDLTVLRYQQGQATQLEISDARLALLQSRTNLAQALSDFYVASAGVTRAVGSTPAAATVPTSTPSNNR